MLNEVRLIGNVGNDPEVKPLTNGKVANFRVATSETYKDKEGNRQEKTEWHRIVCFGNVADIAERYVRKGGQVFIAGKIQTRDWENKDGVKQYTTEILAGTIRLLGKKEKGAEPSGENKAPAPAASTKSEKKTAPAKSEKAPASAPSLLDSPESDDDLPF